ncbi:hypothetical protein [Stigmatella aurantiaca]|uniref:hypothetical protein n=1 Tax=Stigmatella aurantiaca TaxID=41 RepID=UPI0015A56788|nr:hypothetical protein [Stigmatella aurantiaca]
MIEYVLDQERREFVAVSGHGEKQAPGQRSFLKLEFEGMAFQPFDDSFDGS